MIMSIVWDAGKPMTVKQIHHALVGDYEHNVTYTAAMTTMTRLYEKGIFTGEKLNFAYLYTVKWKPENTQQPATRI